jgi:NAD(P)-dependent dehydrogenase (short-subunit alcohol dehydrogenase family)
MDNPFSLEHKTAVVTGGATGLGFAVSKAFIEAGARVVIVQRTEDKAQKAVEELGGDAHFMIADITEKEYLPALVAEIEDKHGCVDILVNNAGIHVKKAALEVDDDDFAKVVDVNLNSVFALSREFGRRMVERGSGSILMISSMAAIYGLPYTVAYSSAKTGILGLMRGLISEFSPKGVRINTILPGFIDSPMAQRALNSDPERKKKVLSRTPLGRLGDPMDVGYAAVYLSSGAARFITGAELKVDGGNAIGF